MSILQDKNLLWRLKWCHNKLYSVRAFIKTGNEQNIKMHILQ